MSLTREEVKKVAHLARLALTDEELDAFQGQLTAVLAYAEMLNDLDLSEVAPTAHAIPRENVLREDSVEPSLPLEDVLYNAARHQGGQFLIQSVLTD